MFKFILRIIIILFYTIGSFSGLTFAQENQLRFEHISVKQGLSQSTVFSIVQDSRGFMWFGTRTGGVNKFDGHSFKIYKSDPDDLYSISGNEILAVFEDSKGRMWMGTRNFGLNRFDYNTERFYNYLNHNISKTDRNIKTVNGFVEDYKGRIWISTLGGLCLYDEKNDSIIRFHNLKNQDSYGIAAICLAQDSLLCFGGKTGVYVFNTNTKKIIKHFLHDKNEPNSLSSNTIISILYDKKDQLWVGTRNEGLNKLKNLSDNNITHIKHDKNDNSSISSNVIRAIDEDKKGNIWICTFSGLNQLTKTESQKKQPKFIHYKNDPNKTKSLGQDLLFSFYVDIWDNYWIGTWSNGVDYLNIQSKKFDHFKFNKNKNYGIQNNHVNAFTENDYGIWIGTDGGGISLLNREKNIFKYHITTKDKPGIINNNDIRTLFSESGNIIWIGGIESLVRYNCENHISKTFFKDHIINSIIAGVNDELWIGTSSGLIKLNKKDYTYQNYYRDDSDTSSLADNNISILYKDCNNDIWFGTKRGLHLYNRKKDNFIWFQHSVENSKTLSNDNVVSINNDNEGNLWIGTYNGLNRYVPETQSFIRFNEKEGLPDNVINGILPDDSGNLWISTNKGLARIRTEKQSDKEVLKVRHYTESDGLQSDEFIRHSCYKTKDGELIFGGINGFNIFNPKSIKDNTNKPKVVITELKLFNKEVKVNDDTHLLTTNISQTEKVTFSPRQSVFSICFAALSYDSPEKNQFAYKLNGFENNWNYVTNKNEAYYTNLDAGEYTFMVKAANNDGVWNENYTTLNINILPPWWESWEFRMFLSTILILMFLGLYYYRLKSIRNRNKFLEETVATRTVMLKEANNKLIEKQEEITTQNEELSAHRNHLESLVKSRTSELEIALKKAKESDELKSAFIANMSHEIRTPMNAVIGFSSLLLDEEITYEQQSEFVEIIQSNSKVLLRLIDEIIDLSLIESNQLKLKNEKLNLNTFIDHIYSYYFLSNKSETVKIIKRNSLFSNNIILYTDEIRLKQIITNLMDNAKKYTNKGHIELGTYCDKVNLYMYVEDTGIGISDDCINHIFMPFTKIEDNKTAWKEGLGLGLAISNKIAVAIGGKIIVKSEEGFGSVFTFSVPINHILMDTNNSHNKSML